MSSTQKTTIIDRFYKPSKGQALHEKNVIIIFILIKV